MLNNFFVYDRLLCYSLHSPLPSMIRSAPFLYKGLTPYDQITFAKAFQIAFQGIGKDRCWCMKKHTHAVFRGFSTSKTKTLLYKNKDARPLILAMTGRYYEENKSIIVRKAICTSKYCLNPSHYYWGTRSDVAYESAQRRETGVNNDLITKLRIENAGGISSLKLSKTYKIPYHTVRRICNNETYEEVADTMQSDNLTEVWERMLLTCEELTATYPAEAKKFNLTYHMTNELECPWHHQGQSKHKGNFGLMGECLDCMEEIKKGRCTVDVQNFDFRWYWQVKRFWDQVDITDPDLCWKWEGAARKNNTESTAYFPSPFHSAKTQSAPRVAFWLSRGYTGKYRIFSKPKCKSFCCNPTHLTIKELKNYPDPNEIEKIRLNHGNIFKHYKDKKKEDSIEKQ